jgi:hypothetical protein
MPVWRELLSSGKKSETTRIESRKMVGLGRVELPTNGLGIGQLFLNLYVFSVFSSVNFALFWA